MKVVKCGAMLGANFNVGSEKESSPIASPAADVVLLV